MRYEPGLLESDIDADPRLVVVSGSTGFRWSLESKGDAIPDRSQLSVVIQGRRGREVLLSQRYSESGECGWEQWRDCVAVDLLPIDQTGSVAGETVSVPVSAGGDEEEIEFLRGKYPGEVLIRPSAKRTVYPSVVIWRRVQNGIWRQASEGERIPEGGTRVTIPQFQGAFAVGREGGHLEAVQFFAFGSLLRGTEQDFSEILTLYPDPPLREERLDMWPAWVQDQVVGPIEEYRELNKCNLDHYNIDHELRVLIRKALLGPFLEPEFDEWQPQLSIEEFTSIQWPNLDKIFRTVDAPAAFKVAFDLRASPLLEEALEWAGPLTAHVDSCLRLASIREQHRRVQSCLLFECESLKISVSLYHALEGSS